MAITTNNAKVRQWIANSLFTLVLAIGTFYVNSIAAQHEREEATTTSFRNEQLKTNSAQDLEIAVLKAKLENILRLLEDGKAHDERMERKLDALPTRLGR
jgi:hypothetical protein